MKIGIVYTSTTPELIELVEKELKKQIGTQATLESYQDPSILQEIRDNEYITTTASARLVGLYVDAINNGADIVYNCCSSVGEVADSAVDFGKFAGVPIIRIDEDMCRQAVRDGKRIGVMATLISTLTPTKNTIQRVAREMNKEIILVDALVENAFGLSENEFKEKMLDTAEQIKNEVDVILFAQGSMAYCEEVVAQQTNKVVVSSPRFGAIAVKEALKKKGLLV